MEFLEDILKDHEGAYDHLKKTVEGNKKIKIANLGTGDYVKKDKFLTVETKANDLEASMKKRDEELAKLKTNAGDNEELTKSIQVMQESHATEKTQLEDSLKKTQLDYAIALAVEQTRPADANASKAIISLLKTDAISLDGENLIGLTDQIAGLKESSKYLFDGEGEGGGGGEGNNPAGDDDDDDDDKGSEEKFRNAAHGGQVPKRVSD